MEKIKGGCSCFLWFAGWLFTIGFLHLEFWQGLVSAIIWPYYIGIYISTLLQR